MIIRLVRHGQSLANTREVDVKSYGDHKVPLSQLGKEQARAAGVALGAAAFENSLVYRSPYRRTRETLAEIAAGAGVDLEKIRVFEDPRLRELDHGYADVDEQEPMRETHGWFYYRYQGGESPADCYDRMSAFLESFMREIERKQPTRALIVTHGLAIRCFVMRFLHLSVEEFESLGNPRNCAIITIAPLAQVPDPQFVSGAWGCGGLTFREQET